MGEVLRITDPIRATLASTSTNILSMNRLREPSSTILEDILGYTSKLKILLHIPAKAFYL